MTLREQLMRDEGLRLYPYTDDTGHLTIGYGYNLDNGIPQFIADALLDYKMTEASSELTKALPWSQTLDDARREALVNLVYNMGLNGLLTFRRMLIAMTNRDYAEAARELLDSRYASQVGQRANRLARQIETGQCE